MEKIIRKYARPNSVPLTAGAKYGVLPQHLTVKQIVALHFPDKQDRSQRLILSNALHEAIKAGELKAETKESRRLIQTSMRWIDGTRVNPNIQDKYQTLHFYRIHRDDYRAFLIASEEWPPVPDSLLAGWWGQESIPSQNVAPLPPRENDIHRLLERTFLLLRDELKRPPQAKEILRALEKDQDKYDPDGIIDEIKADILYWQSTDGNDCQMTLKTLRNRVSIIRKKFNSRFISPVPAGISDGNSVR